MNQPKKEPLPLTKSTEGKSRIEESPSLDEVFYYTCPECLWTDVATARLISGQDPNKTLVCYKCGYDGNRWHPGW